MPRRSAREAKKEPPLFKNKQWQQCYQDWLRSLENKSGSNDTARSWGGMARRFFTDPAKTPDKYTRADINEYVHRHVYHAAGYRAPSPETQNSRLRALHSFYAYASEYDVLFRNGTRPLLHTPPPTRGLNVVKTGSKPKGLTENELKRLFAAIPRETIKHKRDFALFSFYFWSCRRRMEILRLRWGDISECQFIEDGQMSTGHIYRYSSKGHRRDVFTAKLADEAWDALIDYLQASGRLEHMQADSPLFITTYYHAGPDRAISGNAANDILQGYADLAGLQSGRKITLHWLRHTRAQLQWIDDPSEKALTKVQKLLGHKTITTTMLYLAGAEEKPDDGAVRLAKKLGKL